MDFNFFNQRIKPRLLIVRLIPYTDIPMELVELTDSDMVPANFLPEKGECREALTKDDGLITYFHYPTIRFYVEDGSVAGYFCPVCKYSLFKLEYYKEGVEYTVDPVDRKSKNKRIGVSFVRRAYLGKRGD